MHADRDNSEQPETLPTHNHYAYRYAVCGAELKTLRPTPGLPSCEACDRAMSDMEAQEAAQRPSPGLMAPDATTDTPDTLGGAEGRTERVLPEYLAEKDAEIAGLRAEVERLREINRELVDTHNVYLGHVATVERERNELRAEVKRMRGTLEAANDAVAEAATERAEAAERALAVERAKMAHIEALANEHIVCSGCPTPWWLSAALAEPQATEGDCK